MKHLLRTGLGQAAVYAAALVLTKLTAIVMLPVFTHYLTPEEYGRLDILQTLANLLSLVIGFGLADTLFRFTGEAKTDTERKEAAAGVLGLALLTFVASAVLLQLAAPWIAAYLPGGVTETQTRLILGSLSFTALILVPLSWIRQQDRAPLYFGGSAGRAVVQAVLAALFLSLGFGIDGVLLAGFICASTLCAILVVIQWRHTGCRLSLPLLTRHGRFGGTLLIAGLATFVLDSFDRWILADAIGAHALAMYALAGKIAIMAAFATQPFGLWWYPRRFNVLNRDNGNVTCARMTELGICIALLGAVGIAGIGPATVTWLAPEAYASAIQFISALALLAALNESTSLINTGVLSNEKSTLPAQIDWTAAATALAGYLWLIPEMGAWGAIAATTVALGLRFILYVVFGQRRRRLPYRFGRLGGVALIAGAASYAAHMSGGVVLPFVVASCGAVVIIGFGLVSGLLPTPSRGMLKAVA
ncbi:MAG: lipopolysaccharide biosynthesis protein [Alphaproteobacteria bacterium]|nr:lipopolysaccharide biosynthesis protein [Alphaproteobacteria bacterium]